MRENKFNPPNEAAMERLLERYDYGPTGIILRLAWRAGLTRSEIGALTWEQVDFDAALLRLPDREVPLEAETAECLRRWKNRCGGFSGYVAVSDRLRKPLVPQSITTMARNALDSEGQTGVRLRDLRYDFIRRQFETHDWPYVLRVSGVSLSAYRAGLYGTGRDAPAPPVEEPRNGAAGEDFALWRVLQAERTHAAGIALWLTSRLGLQCREIVRLTWDDVDFDRNVLRAGGREIALTVSVRHVLEDVRALRRPEDDPHVILTPRSRRPMDAARLATMARAALIRGGIEGKTMQDFRRDAAWEAQREKLRAYVAKNGGVTRMEAAELLDLSPGQAYDRLTRLTRAGELVLLNTRWYPAEAVVAPEDRERAVLRHVAEHGPATRREVEALLGVKRLKATEIINRMVAAGKLAPVPGTWRYGPAEYDNSTSLRQTDAVLQTEN